jgi:hypothetical protein
MSSKPLKKQFNEFSAAGASLHIKLFPVSPGTARHAKSTFPPSLGDFTKLRTGAILET